MKFKEQYQKDINQILPDKESVKNLAVLMKKAAAETDSGEKRTSIDISRKRRNVYVRYTSIAAVVVLCILFAAVAVNITGLFKNNTGETKRDGSSNTNDINKTLAEEGYNIRGEQIFDVTQWYEGCISDEEVYQRFLDIISDSENIEKVYKNNENKFDDSMLMTDSDILQLLESVADGSIVSGETDIDEKDKMYYMMVFENGYIVKFTIDDTYMQLSGFDFAVKIS